MVIEAGKNMCSDVHARSTTHTHNLNMEYLYRRYVDFTLSKSRYNRSWFPDHYDAVRNG